ncbi:MAG: NADH-quinone oxidoreductase subunit NuoH [Herpetosiphonaceae bacterium]|nr:NADH-quinone oxidoreductase subunit NuoH [Herpetosiphonaceae bacterium]
MLRVLILLVQSLAVFLIATTGFAYLTLFERRLLARLQHRIGPNRAGPGGAFQPLADAVKLFFKEDITPTEADKVVYTIAPALAMIPAILLFAVIPVGGPFRLLGQGTPQTIGPGLQAAGTPLQLAPGISVGVLFLLAVTSIGVYGITLGGWSSANKYSMLGGIRSSAQLISYELALGLSVMVPVMLASSLNLEKIVENQGPLWNVLKPVGFIAFGVFWLASSAEVVRAPFDLVEAEQELVGGYNTEYSSMKFALFFMAEYIKLIAVSAIGVTLFFGGWHGPGVERLYAAAIQQNSGLLFNLAALASLGYFLIKLIIFLAFSVLVRATIPRMKYDQLMDLGWKRLLPISLATVAVTAIGAVLIGPSVPFLSRLFS